MYGKWIRYSSKRVSLLFSINVSETIQKIRAENFQMPSATFYEIQLIRTDHVKRLYNSARKRPHVTYDDLGTMAGSTPFESLLFPGPIEPLQILT